ncbi:hypothetical protein G4177_16830 [Corallococcus sp. ZKHCc1 1396]|uniref:Lipoprotein n=1 Tax=Corallococcus soli TaxID=2710757 RepID=A0ABR9PPK8_9BACT|nr:MULTISPECIES: hypothetical protein [Corallococcus]MBE4749830.1 hypothetical protein [Corallococcus soli]MCY1035611.1 hypothetical protein [Corallococcus sp. BB11-1]
MRPLATTTWLLLALLALGGCNRLQPDSPVGAYQTFHRHVQRGELPKAYAGLSQPTQSNLKAQAQKVSEASGGMVKPEPLALFFANVPVPPDVQEVSLLRQEGDVATVVVRSAGRSGEVRMVREPSGWKVDLSASPQP